MRQLLNDHQAVALLPGHFPIPVRYQGAWWLVPIEGPQHDYVPASEQQGDQFEQLAARYRAAQASIQAADQQRQTPR
jgi:hypothetical protein